MCQVATPSVIITSAPQLTREAHLQTGSQKCGGRPSPPNGSFPHYLATGESITCGMFKYKKADLAGVADPHLVTRNAGPTDLVVHFFDVWVREHLNGWDVVASTLEPGLLERERDTLTSVR